MPLEILACIDTQPRGADLYCFFRVSDGSRSATFAVPITAQAMNPVGGQARTAEVLMPLAEAWLRKHLELRPNPFSESAPPIPHVTAAIADHWFAYENLP
jgi:hypothetical protein